MPLISQLPCPFCEKTTETTVGLQKHIFKFHQSECSDCNKSFASGPEKDQHDCNPNETAEDVKVAVCEKCEAVFPNAAKLQMHLKKTFKEDVSCIICVDQPSFHIRDEFFQHFEQHHPAEQVNRLDRGQNSAIFIFFFLLFVFVDSMLCL